MWFAVKFKGCHQIDQVVSSTNPNSEYMYSRVFFDLSDFEKIYFGMYSDIRQPYGTNYAMEPIEVCYPIGTYGPGLPFPLQDFSEWVEDYFRRCIPAGLFSGIKGEAIFRHNMIFPQQVVRKREYEAQTEATVGWLTGEAPAWVRPRANDTPLGGIDVSSTLSQPSRHALDRDD